MLQYQAQETRNSNRPGHVERSNEAVLVAEARALAGFQRNIAIEQINQSTSVKHTNVNSGNRIYTASKT